MPVTDRLLFLWGGRTKEEIYAHALANMRRMYPLQFFTPEELLSRAFGMPFPRQESAPSIYVLTIKGIRNGAAAILYPEAEKLLTQAFPDGCWMIPSSRHEWIAADRRSVKDSTALREAVEQMNRLETKPAAVWEN